MVPVIEVVAAVLSAPLLPRKDVIRLMLHHYALLEGRIVVLAIVSTVRRDHHRIKLILCVFFRCEGVVRYPNVVVEKSHLLKIQLINYNLASTKSN